MEKEFFKSPYLELFWSAFFLHFPGLRIRSQCGKIRKKYGPEQLRIRTLFTQSYRQQSNTPKSWLDAWRASLWPIFAFATRSLKESKHITRRKLLLFTLSYRECNILWKTQEPLFKSKLIAIPWNLLPQSWNAFSSKTKRKTAVFKNHKRELKIAKSKKVSQVSNKQHKRNLNMRSWPGNTNLESETGNTNQGLGQEKTWFKFCKFWYIFLHFSSEVIYFLEVGAFPII